MPILPRSFREFLAVMDRSREVRAALALYILDSRLSPPLTSGKARDPASSTQAPPQTPPDRLTPLREALAFLETLPRENGRVVLSLEQGGLVRVSPDDELAGLRKDVAWLERGEAGLLDVLAENFPGSMSGLTQELSRLEDHLGDRSWHCLLADRDGTLNTYCGLYRTAVQPAWNAVFLTRFVLTRVRWPVLLSSGPLEGLEALSTMPSGTCILAGSKGREYRDLAGRRGAWEVAPGQLAVLDAFTRRLEDLLAQPEYAAFGLVGSGLQRKLGQTTVARQDVYGSIPAAKSEQFLATLRQLVTACDPAGEVLRLEDTGLDVEILLTVEGPDGLKDFDKGDATRFLDTRLGLDLARGPNLVCGDTAADLRMLEASMTACPETWAVFVTRDKNLAQKARDICPKVSLASSPDTLMMALGKRGLRKY